MEKTSWIQWIRCYCWTHKNHAKFEVVTAVVTKSSIFWDITPYIPLKVNRCFRGTYSLHLQGRRIRPPKVITLLHKNQNWIPSSVFSVDLQRAYKIFSKYVQYFLKYKKRTDGRGWSPLYAITYVALSGHETNKICKIPKCLAFGAQSFFWQGLNVFGISRFSSEFQAQRNQNESTFNGSFSLGIQNMLNNHPHEIKNISEGKSLEIH
jgi:hypothetical protein